MRSGTHSNQAKKLTNLDAKLNHWMNEANVHWIWYRKKCVGDRLIYDYGKGLGLDSGFEK